MVHFVLDDLGCPPRISLLLRLKINVLELNGYLLIANGLPYPWQRETTLLRRIGPRLHGNDRIDQDHLFVAVTDDDNVFEHTNHIGRHTDAAIQMGTQGIQQIFRHLPISLSRSH